MTDLLFEKYNASLSDYVGRKPMLVISQLSSFVSRLLLLVSRNVPTFYIAGIFYGFGNFFYNVCIAWLCDVLKKEDRGRAFGLLLGISIGLGFTVGLPVGAVLTIPDPYLPVQISLIVSAVNMLFLLLVPVDDTVCTQLREIEHQLDSGSNTSTNKSKTKYVTNPVVAHTSSTSDSSQNKTQLTSSQWKMWPSGLLSHRELPVDINHYLIHNSLYGVLKVSMAGQCGYDWLTDFFLNIAQQVLQLSFITFGIQVFGWSTAVAGIALAFVGITVAIVSPLFLTRYDEMSMVTLGASVQSIGYLFLAIVGSNISAMGVVYALGYLAVALLAFGGLWISSLQALILRQYPENIQGEVAGALAQVNLLAVIPAYPISLLFSYMLSSAATIYWPGVIFALVKTNLNSFSPSCCNAHLCIIKFNYNVDNILDDYRVEYPLLCSQSRAIVAQQATSQSSANS